MRCPALLYAFLFLATIDYERLTSGLRRSRDVTQDEVCRRSPHHICQNEQCITVANARCDGVTQCGDGSDENSCPSSGCILPQQPFGGSLQMGLCVGNSCDIVPGRIIPQGTLLIYRCNDDYTLAGNNVSFCYITRWYGHPSCVKTCPVLRPEGVDISCRYNGKSVSCESTIIPGTKATLACKHSYKIPLGNDPGYRKLTCLHQGTWDRVVFHCIPECGTAIAHGRPMIVNGHRAKLGGYPWHVGVYERISTENLEQICAGTLISPDLVISAAHCFWDETFRTVKNISRFAVAVGKYYRSYTTLLDPYVQKSQVKNIDVASAYFGWSGNYAQDIALVRVQTPFTLSTLIRPICIDWDNRHEDQHLRFGQVGKAVGWGRTASGTPSVELQEINLPYISRQNCVTTAPEEFKGFVTADKFCAGYLNGSSLCEGDSGGGLFFKFDGLWFLRGIVSVSPTFHGTCNNNFYTAFTNIGNFLGWIRTVNFMPRNFDDAGDVTISYDMRVASIGDTVTIISSSSCLLPEQPSNGSFELSSCTGQCNVAAGSRVPINSSLIYRCDEGYTLIGNNITVCFNNEWDPPPTCSRNYCPALRSTSVDFDCNYRGENVSCEFKIVPLTTAILTCKDSYKISFLNNSGYREITCLQDGAWDRPVIDCGLDNVTENEGHIYSVPVTVNVSVDDGPFLEGSELSIACIVDGFPLPRVKWFKDGNPIEIDNRTTISAANKLIITNAQKSDSGRYQCQAANEITSNADIVDITVAGIYIHRNCQDNSFFTKCQMVVQGHFCTFQYYFRFCCRSCTEAGMLPAKGPHTTQKRRSVPSLS